MRWQVNGARSVNERNVSWCCLPDSTSLPPAHALSWTSRTGWHIHPENSHPVGDYGRHIPRGLG